MKQYIIQHITWILPAITAGLFVLLLFNMMVPKAVIDTYKINMVEEEGDKEYLLPLEVGQSILYQVDTGSRPMMGIHVGVSKNGGTFQTGELICTVSKTGEASEQPISETHIALAPLQELQYVYFPFEDYEACQGVIQISFRYDAQGTLGEYPSLLANGRQVVGANTHKITISATDGMPEKNLLLDGNLKTMYIYTHDTYPLVYDLRILTLSFFAASMMLSYPKCKLRFLRWRKETKA
ncbi:MAG: hypothetical protein RRX92_08670 [Lachnospiraceae bacterium]